jgi:hypothetical protein
MTGINLLHARGGRPRLNPLPALTSGAAATITGHVHLPGTQVRLLITSIVTSPPQPGNPTWSAPVTSDARGNFTTTLTPGVSGPLKIWVALAKNLKNQWGQTATAA